MYRMHRVCFLTLIFCVTATTVCSAGKKTISENIDLQIASKSRQNTPAMQFHGTSAAEFYAWKKKFRKKLTELLGDSSPPRQWQVKQLSQVKLKDHTRYELQLTADGVPAMPVYLLIPAGANPASKLPGVLCVHGHGPFGNEPIVGLKDTPEIAENIKKHNYDYGLQFVRRGYVVVAPCMIPFGKRVDRKRYGSQDPCAVTFVRMQALGQLPLTENLRDLRWSISLLQSRPEVIKERIGCLGLSYGGRMTMLVTAVDERIKVADISGALNLLQERITHRYSCGSQIIPGLLKYGDYSEIGSLIAPRPVVWETGSKDGLIVPQWDKLFRHRLELAYKACQAENNLHYDRFEGGHVFSGRVAFSLFDQVLKADGPN